MKTRNPILGAALALALLAGSPAAGWAQTDHQHGRMMGQDTSRAGPMMPGQMMPGMMAACGHMMGMMGMMGPGMMGRMGPDMQGMMGGGMHGGMGGAMMGHSMMRADMMGHGMMTGTFAPQFLLGLRDELGLSDDQAARLEETQDELRSAMQARAQELHDLHDSLMQARENEDWGALEDGIDRAAELQAELAKARVESARETLAVLSAEQRQKLESWRQGALMYRQGMQGMLRHMQQGTSSGNRP